MGFFARIDQMSFEAKTIGTVICLVFGLITSVPVLRDLSKKKKPKPSASRPIVAGLGTGYGGGSGHGSARNVTFGELPPPPSPPARVEPDTFLPATLVNSGDFFYDLSITPKGTLKTLEVMGAKTVRVKSSSNEGRTWTIAGKEVSLSDAEQGTENSIWSRLQFTDELNGWAYGNEMGLWHTKNGGNTWLEVTLPEPMDFIEMAWATPKVGYLAGSVRAAGVVSQVAIMKTTDGGYSWDIVTHLDAARGAVWQLLAPTETDLLLNLNSTKLLRSSNGGLTWDEAKEAGSVRKVVCNALGTGWIVGGNGNFRRFTGYGAWFAPPQKMPSGLRNANWVDIDLDPRTGYGVAVGSEGALLVTYNRGNSWELTGLADSGKKVASGADLIQANFDHVTVRGCVAYISVSGRVYRV